MNTQTTHHPISLSKFFVTGVYLLTNLVLFGFSFYVHYLLTSSAVNDGDNLLENTGMWLLVAVKIGGANIILSQIFSEINVKSKKS